MQRETQAAIRGRTTREAAAYTGVYRPAEGPDVRLSKWRGSFLVDHKRPGACGARIKLSAAGGVPDRRLHPDRRAGACHQSARYIDTVGFPGDDQRQLPGASQHDLHGFGRWNQLYRDHDGADRRVDPGGLQCGADSGRTDHCLRGPQLRLLKTRPCSGCPEQGRFFSGALETSAQCRYTELEKALRFEKQERTRCNEGICRYEPRRAGGRVCCGFPEV